MSILKSEKVDFKTESISRDTEAQYYNNKMTNSSRRPNNPKIMCIL